MDAAAVVTEKAGAHGPLHLFEIEYTAGPGCPMFTLRTWAYDAEHAVEKFVDAPDGDGWDLHRIARVRADKPKHGWAWRSVA